MKISKSVLDPNLGVFVQAVVDASKEGWEIDPSNPPMLLGYCYECQMLRDESIVDAPKLSRAEILAKARAAKAERKDAAAEEPSGSTPE